ncbi:ribosomal protection tetracycline resistance protein [Streptomyces sp. Ag109_G2-6]|uniref:elongation factor G n=1 Tax=Streptomyces TaxID=1883 RepID=UPI000FBABDB9|nr:MULTISPECIES: TetM/TetW/TetO/TetS family tetracycline resistance ribosomal protection protein [Streptomyces]RPF30000.1 ribosomal protection tetracycline resistance protein [Streptomyces sp. Ag109_G2-6]
MQPTSRTLNLGILAHVDAGKTSLTERLLYAAGVIDEIGSVDAGNTQADSLEMERRRGITIKSAVVNFPLGSGESAVSVNLIDTPGHPDFIAEVERVLGVLDGAVLVVSAVEGVQPQTRVLMRTLKRLSIPTLLFVNKADRPGADDARVLREIERELAVPVIRMGRVTAGIGTKAARISASTGGDEAYTRHLLDVLTTHDDDLLGAYLDHGTSLPYARLRTALAAQTRTARVYPVYVGSAITGAGIDGLVEGIGELLPAAHGDPHGPLSARVFKVERGQGGERIAYVRLFSGELGARAHVPVSGTRHKVTELAVFDRGKAVRRPVARAGQIATLRGLPTVRIGDVVGREPEGRPYGRVFAAPTLESVVVPADPERTGDLHTALAQLAEQDPLIGLRQDPDGGEPSVSLYGEVQKEVLAATLAEEYGITVSFRETTPICVERVTGTGAAYEVLDHEGNPFLATVGLRVEPAPVGSGVVFRREVELGSLPLGYMRAVEETVYATLRQGLSGWQVPDCAVTMTHSGFCSIRSTAGEFRALTPLVLMAALRQAGTVVHEPVHRFRLEFSQDAYPAVALALARHGAQPGTPVAVGDAYLVEGHLPADRVHGLERELPELTSGTGVLETAFAHYRPSRTPRVRERSDHNPLNREEYLLHAHRRM